MLSPPYLLSSRAPLAGLWTAAAPSYSLNQPALFPAAEPAPPAELNSRRKRRRGLTKSVARIAVERCGTRETARVRRKGRLDDLLNKYASGIGNAIVTLTDVTESSITTNMCELSALCKSAENSLLSYDVIGGTDLRFEAQGWGAVPEPAWADARGLRP